MIGQPGVLADRTMAFGGKDFGIGLPEIGVEDGALSIRRRQRVPQGLSGLIGAWTNGATDDQTGIDIQRQPQPALAALVANERP